MWFFDIRMLPSLVFGIVVLLISRRMGNWQIRRDPDSFASVPIINKIFIVWAARAVGIMAIGIFFSMGMNSPPRGMMRKAENRLILLEEGQIVKGEVVECWFDNLAPPAWMILYSFEAPNPKDGQAKTYWGSARGPKQYYAKFSEGDPVSVIYNPAKPKMNCEMYYFLNEPQYRRTFRKAGKLELLANFEDEYELVDYSEMSWLDSARIR